MTRELALQWAIRGVRVNALAPGYFPSEIHQSNAMPEEQKVGGGTGDTQIRNQSAIGCGLMSLGLDGLFSVKLRIFLK